MEENMQSKKRQTNKKKTKSNFVWTPFHESMAKIILSLYETWMAVKKILKKLFIVRILIDSIDYTFYRIFRCFTKNYDDNYAAIFAGYLLMGVVLVPIFVYLNAC